MRSVIVGLGVLLTASAAQAQILFTEDFEPKVIFPGPLAPQNSWTVPAGLGFNVHGYPGNPLGAPANPLGGEQFAGGGPGADFVRAQHVVSFVAEETTITWDLHVRPWAVAPPAVALDNIGSVSMQSSAGAGVRGGTQSLMVWNADDPNDPNDPPIGADGWDNFYQVHDAAGAALGFGAPGPEWQHLQHDRWYRNSAVINLNTGVFRLASITDLTTNTTTTVDMAVAFGGTVYLNGGAGNIEGLPLATALRFFAGGGGTIPVPPENQGNRIAFDNLVISIPTPGAASLLGLGLLAGLRRRR